MKILIVEDEAVLALWLTELVETLGHDVAGPDESEQAARAALGDLRPDFAILDINLGDGGDGVALGRALHREAQVPCLFVTGNRDAGARIADFAFGLVQKPFRPDMVGATIALAEAAIACREVPPAPRGLDLYGDPTRWCRP